MSRNAKWVFAEDVPEAVRGDLASGRWRESARCIERDRDRAVYRYTPAASDMSIVLKEDAASGPIDWVKGLLRCKAAHEFASLQAAARVGLPTPAPLGWVRTSRGGVLATASVPGRTLLETWSDLPPAARPQQTGLLAAVAQLAGQLVREGLDHPALHAGSVAVSQDHEGMRLVLADLRGARSSAAPNLAERRRMLLWLVPVLEELPPVARQRLLDEIATGSDAALASWPELVRHWGRSRAAGWRGWRRRILRESDVCCRLAGDLGRGLAFRPSEPVAAALRTYRAGTTDTESLKSDRKRRVTRVQAAEGQSLVVKEYLRTGWRWLWRPDRRGWLNTARMQQLTARVAACRAWVCTDAGGGYLVQEDVGELCLHDYIPRGCPTAAQRRPWLERVADCLAFLHLCGCFHADLKVANWVAGPGGRLRIVDCDDVRFFRHLPERARERNLGQLAETCPPSLSRRERLRFLVLYARLAELPRERLRMLAGQLPG